MTGQLSEQGRLLLQICFAQVRQPGDRALINEEQVPLSEDDVTDALALFARLNVPVTASKHRAGRRWISINDEYVERAMQQHQRGENDGIDS